MRRHYDARLKWELDENTRFNSQYDCSNLCRNLGIVALVDPQRQ